MIEAAIITKNLVLTVTQNLFEMLFIARDNIDFATLDVCYFCYKRLAAQNSYEHSLASQLLLKLFKPFNNFFLLNS
jgi:hypothetical protein